MLRHREGMSALGLAVPPRHPRQPMGDVLDLDIERRGIEEIEPPSRQHALPGPRCLAVALHRHHRPRVASRFTAAMAVAASPHGR